MELCTLAIETLQSVLLEGRGWGEVTQNAFGAAFGRMDDLDAIVALFKMMRQEVSQPLPSPSS